MESGTDNPVPWNTGVMLMDVSKFQQEWTNILQFGHDRNTTTFPSHDQEWLNWYFWQNDELRKKAIMLNPIWNWKTYWPVIENTPFDYMGTLSSRQINQLYEYILSTEGYKNYSFAWT